jgi:hypothetical protein
MYQPTKLDREREAEARRQARASAARERREMREALQQILAVCRQPIGDSSSGWVRLGRITILAAQGLGIDPADELVSAVRRLRGDDEYDEPAHNDPYEEDLDTPDDDPELAYGERGESDDEDAASPF